jgi:hypothetical protein
MSARERLTLRKATASGAAYVVWNARNDEGLHVGTIVRTGESRDDYPWDWTIVAPSPGTRRVTGVASTRREALDELEAMWATREQAQR